MGIATGIAIATAASAAASAYAAHQQANAAREAAETQSHAADTAMGVQERQYNQARQDFNPYQNAGRQALSEMQIRSAQTPPVFTPGQAYNLGHPAGTPAYASGNPRATTGYMVEPPAPAAQGMPMQGSQGGPAPPGLEQRMQGQGGSLGMPQGAPQADMVTMALPDGRQGPVPRAMVPQLLQRGGRVIQ